MINMEWMSTGDQIYFQKIYGGHCNEKYSGT